MNACASDALSRKYYTRMALPSFCVRRGWTGIPMIIHKSSVARAMAGTERYTARVRYQWASGHE